MKIDAGTILLLFAGYWLYTTGHYEDVLQWLGVGQQIGGESQQPTKSGGQQPTTGCTMDQIQQWAADIKLPVCVAQQFCAEFGRFPQSVGELVNWGNQRGLRQPNGVWKC